MRAKSATRKALAGKRILITRAREQAGKLSSALRELGATVLEIPSIEIRPPRSYRPLDSAIRNAADYDWLILTSVNGVKALFERMKNLKLRPSALKHLKIAAIGPATKTAIEQHGLKVSVVPREYIAESVVEALAGRVKGKRVLLARAKVARDVIPQELRRAGARLDVVEAYETIVPKSSRAKLRAALKDPKRRPDAITFTSSSTVRNVYALLDARSRKHLEGVLLASIGPVTSATLRDLGLPVSVEAGEYTIPGLVRALTARLRRP